MGELAVLTPPSNVEAFRASTDAATLCREIVLKTAIKIQNRRYVGVEGWMSIALAHGCACSADHVERVNDEGMSGFKAIGTIRRMSDGQEIARAEGFLGDDEGMWAKRPVYARRAMAQTRAISRACRSAFAHVVVMIDAGLSTTPAEEVPYGGFNNDERTIEGAVNQPHASPRKGERGHPDWPEGPHKNVTSLKAAWRALKKEIERAPDPDSLDALLVSEKDTLRQIGQALPSWWTGEGLEEGQGIAEWIAKRQTELAAESADTAPIAGDTQPAGNGNTIIDAG